MATEMPRSYQGPMSEDDYLAVVERIQQAMAIEPFQPSVVDVVKLLSDWRDLSNAKHMLAEEREAWKARAREESAENDQWQRKQAESWAEIERLRAALTAGVATHGEACRLGEDCQFMKDARLALASPKQG